MDWALFFLILAITLDVVVYTFIVRSVQPTRHRRRIQEDETRSQEDKMTKLNRTDWHEILLTIATGLLVGLSSEASDTGWLQRQR